MGWTKDEIEQMTAKLMRRCHGDGINRDETETVCLLAETSIMNRESCAKVMEENETLKTAFDQEHARAERLMGELEASEARYLSAVKGRGDFRAALRAARKEIEKS